LASFAGAWLVRVLMQVVIHMNAGVVVCRPSIWRFVPDFSARLQGPVSTPALPAQ